MASPASGWQLTQRAVKGVAIVLGGLCTFVSFASVVGVVTGNGWARAVVALALCLAVPAVAVDRALPRAGPAKPRPGLAGDVIALVYLGVALAFIGVGQPVTRPLLVREADRLAEDGREVPAHVVYFLAGVRPVDAPVEAIPAAATPVAPSASGSGGP
jgi:hypothetical protein